MGRVSRFAAIGVASTLLYAICAYGFSFAMPATTASIGAYAIAAVFSYTGHKYVTFASGGAHRLEMPRFLTLTALGIALAWLLPLVLTETLGLAPLVPIAATCILVPLLNYLILDRWVFAAAGGERRA